MEFPKEFELYASDNLADLKNPAFLADPANKTSGTFGKTWTGNVYQDYVAFDKPVQGRYAKFVVTSTYNSSGTYTSMSEIDFTGQTGLNENAALTDLKINGNTVSDFASDKLNYNVQVPHAVTVVDVTYTAADPNAAVTIQGGTDLQVGDNRIAVTVTADGATREYIVIVRRAEQSANENAALSDLKINGKTISDFASDKLNYTVQVPHTVTVVDVTYTAADPNAAVTIRGGTDLQVGDNRITLTVTVDGATREYIVIVRRAEESIIRPNPPSTTPPSTSPSTPSPTSPTKPEKEEAQKPDLPTNAVTVPDEALSGEMKAVHVKLPDGKTSVILSDKQAQKLMGRGLIVESEQAQLNVPAALVESLLKSLPASEKSASIVIKLEAVETTKAQQLLQKANGSGNARYTLGGKMLTLSLAAIDGNGKQHRLDPFPKPAKLAFRIPAGMNPKLAGIYQMAGNGAIHVGGKLNADRKAMEVDLNHFGEYALLSLDKSYTDVDVSHWAYETIHELSAKQIINGMTETRFAPTGSVTRAEFAALLARTLNLSPTDTTPFSDVADDAWYAKEVSAAYQSGIVTGAGQKLFEPNRKITREEMAVMLVRAYELQMASKPGAVSVQMKDENSISGWALPYVKKAVEAKLLSGRKEGLFVPNGLTTRAEAAQAVYNLLQSFARADA